MIVNDIRKEFYDLLIGKHVLLLVNYDVDALCGCKIVQHLLRCDQIPYTLIAVQGLQELQESFQQHCNQVSRILLINCGGMTDLVEFLQPPDESILFVVDSHRPSHVCNIYSDGQIRLLGRVRPDENIPDLDDIFKDEESDEESDVDIFESGQPSKDVEDVSSKTTTEKAIERRRNRRQWEEKRKQLLFDYTQFNYYGQSSSILMFEVTWKLSKDTSELLLWAIIGLTEQYVLEKIEPQQYLLQASDLQGHVARMAPGRGRGSGRGQHQRNRAMKKANNNYHPVVQDGSGDASEESADLPKECLQITFDRDLQLSLYRHWTLEESIRHTTLTTCGFKLWTLTGEKRLYGFLAELGLPLVECRQKYSAMDPSLKQELLQTFESSCEKYKFHDLIYASFLAVSGYGSCFTASDYVYSALALLETSSSHEQQRDPPRRFMEALDSLSIRKRSVLEEGISRARKLLTAIYKQVQAMLNLGQIVRAGPFLYTVIQEGVTDGWLFSEPNSIMLLAKIALKCHYANRPTKKSKSLPLVLVGPPRDVATPAANAASTGTTCAYSLVCGIPPLAEDSPKSLFGKAFEQAVNGSKCNAKLDYFDGSVILIAAEDRTRFIDALSSLLA